MKQARAQGNSRACRLTLRPEGNVKDKGMGSMAARKRPRHGTPWSQDLPPHGHRGLGHGTWPTHLLFALRPSPELAPALAATARVCFWALPSLWTAPAQQRISIVAMADAPPPAAVPAAAEQPGEPQAPAAVEQPAPGAAAAAEPEATATAGVPPAAGETAAPTPAAGDAPADATPAAGQPQQAAAAAGASPSAAAAEPRLPVRAYLEQTGQCERLQLGN